MNPISITRILPVFLLCALGAGCASVGSKFSLKSADALELRQLKSADYVRLFGNPVTKETKTTTDGKFEIAKYVYAFADLGTARSRVLFLEFRNGDLNAFIYSSSFTEDKTKAEGGDVETLKAGIGRLGQSDALAALGKPHGRALCPSMLQDYKDRCGKGAEIWAWVTMETIATLGGKGAKTRSIFVSFDASGKISDVQTEESDHQKRM